MTAASDKTLYCPVWVSATGLVSLRWGKPCDRPSDARRIGKAEVDAGNASISFVVCFSGGEKKPLPTYTYPESAKNIVQHWESLWDETEGP